MPDTFDSLRPHIVDYLHERGIDPRKRFRCLNPAHLDRDPSMGFDPKRNKVHCFACGADYDLFDLMTMDENLTTPLEALLLASHRYGDGTADRPAKQAAPESEGNRGEGGLRSLVLERRTSFFLLSGQLLCPPGRNRLLYHPWLIH